MADRAMADRTLQRFVVAHLLAVVGEWAALVGVFVLAHDAGGSSAVGIVSVCVLTPPIVGAPVTAWAIVRFGALRVRLVAFVVQALASGAAAGVVVADGPAPVAAGLVVVGLGTLVALRPSGAALLPALVRTTRQLTRSNLAVAHCDSASAIVGAICAAGLVSLGGPAAVFVGCAVASALSAATTAWRAPRLASRRDVRRQRRVLRTAATELRRRPGSLGVIAMSAASNVINGAFDVLIVVIALDALEFDDSAVGGFTALVGVGALVSTAVVTLAVRRANLGPTVLVSVVVAALGALAAAISLELPVVFVALPVIGVCMSAADNLAQILLQRSTDPRRLGPMFAGLGLTDAVAQVVGSVVAQVVVAVADAQAALAVVAGLVLVIAASSARSLRDADARADVPVVEMSLLGGLPMFDPLPAAGLEAVARSASREDVAAGTDVIVQGDVGDTFYVVSEGSFDVVMSGEYIRTVRRGGFFGEVALLADVPRTATVRALEDGVVLTVHREPFLMAVVGHDASLAVAAAHVRGLRLDDEVSILAADVPRVAEIGDGG